MLAADLPLTDEEDELDEERLMFFCNPSLLPPCASSWFSHSWNRPKAAEQFLQPPRRTWVSARSVASAGSGRTCVLRDRSHEVPEPRSTAPSKAARKGIDEHRLDRVRIGTGACVACRHGLRADSGPALDGRGR